MVLSKTKQETHPYSLTDINRNTLPWTITDLETGDSDPSPKRLITTLC